MFFVTKPVKEFSANASRTPSTHSTETGISVPTPLRDHASARTSTSTSNAITTVAVQESRDRQAEMLNAACTTSKL
jgi:hypothetical protein